MSNLSPQQFPELFHGSIHPFKVGDVIKSGAGDLAWASSDPKVAGGYAAGGNKRAMSKDRDISTNEQPALFGTIYKVEPINNDVISEDNIHASRTGFKVTGIHSLIPSADLGNK